MSTEAPGFGKTNEPQHMGLRVRLANFVARKVFEWGGDKVMAQPFPFETVLDKEYFEDLPRVQRIIAHAQRFHVPQFISEDTPTGQNVRMLVPEETQAWLTFKPFRIREIGLAREKGRLALCLGFDEDTFAGEGVLQRKLTAPVIGIIDNSRGGKINVTKCDHTRWQGGGSDHRGPIQSATFTFTSRFRDAVGNKDLYFILNAGLLRGQPSAVLLPFRGRLFDHSRAN